MSDTSPTSAPPSDEPTLKARARARTRRVANLLLMTLVMIVPPAVVVSLVFEPQAAGLVIWAVLVAMVPFFMGSWRVAAAMSLLLVLMAPISILAGTVPVAGATLMAVACLVAGISAGWGLNGAAAMLPLGIAYLMINPAPMYGDVVNRYSGQYMAYLMIVLALTSVWVIGAMAVLTRKVTLPKPPRHTVGDTLQYTVLVTVLVSVATWAVLTYSTSVNAVWLILTLLVVIQVDDGATVKKSSARVIGTIAGALLAGVLGTVLTSPQVLGGIAVLCLVAAFYFIGNVHYYWVYCLFMTMLVIFASSPTKVTQVGEARAGYTIVGALIAIAGLGISRLIRKAMRSKGLEPKASTEVISSLRAP